MKILLVSLNHRPEQTGIGKFQGEMAAWLTQKGHAVRVVTAPPYYPAWKIGAGYCGWRYRREVLDGAVVYRVPLYVPSVPTGMQRLIQQATFACFALPVILWQALFWRPDVILMTAPPLLAAPVVLFACALCGAKSHLHVQDFEVDAAFSLGLLKRPWLKRAALRFEQTVLRRFAKVSTISPRMRERLLDKGVAETRAFLIPNWANVGDFDPAAGPGIWREQLAAGPDATFALYSGNMGRKQGIEIIVEAARLLKHNPRIRFVLCGDGAVKEEMAANAAGLANITFLPVQASQGFVDLMMAADIHLLPQHAAAADLVMPSKLGNMLASGRPVVAGAAPGTQVYEAVSGCGIAVEPDNAKAFAAAVEKLASDAISRGQMGLKGRNRAQEEWSRDGILSRMETLFKT